MAKNDLERLIENACSIYKAKNQALIDYVNPPTRFIGKGRMIFCSKSTVDFVGLWNSQFIAIECKQSKENHILMGHIHDHQVIYLDKVNQMGGWAFWAVMLTIEKKKHFYLLPHGAEFHQLHWSTRKSIRIEDLQAHGIALEKKKARDWHTADVKEVAYLDFLPVVEKYTLEQFNED